VITLGDTSHVEAARVTPCLHYHGELSLADGDKLRNEAAMDQERGKGVLRSIIVPSHSQPVQCPVRAALCKSWSDDIGISRMISFVLHMDYEPITRLSLG
jgi:hypothetical protein